MYLGLDASTQSISGIIIDPANGSIIAEASINFGNTLPEYQSPSGFLPNGENGEVHADPGMWLDALELLLDQLKEQTDLSKIKAISGAGQQHATVYLNNSFTSTLAALTPEKPLSEQIQPTLSRSTAPIWMDSSTSEECAEIAQALGGDEQVCAISGSTATPRFSGPQIRKFAKTDPASYAATTLIHLNSSFFASVLAGKSSPIDLGDGAGMNLVNLTNANWDPALLEATAPNLVDKLPPLASSGSFVSNISSYFVEKYGFQPDCRILTWTGDNPASLVGMGAAHPGKLVISLGTSDTLFAAMPEALTDPNGYGHVFGNPLGGFMTLTCIANGSLARETVKENDKLSWNDFERDSIASQPAGNNGKFALPFFIPEITPRVSPNELVTNNWDYATADTATKVRGVLEGQFLNIRYNTEWLELTPETVLLTGGASKNTGIAQCAANVFQAETKRINVSSSVALGGAFLAAIDSGYNYDSLVEQFCPTAPHSTVQPESDSNFYPSHRSELEAIIQQLCSNERASQQDCVLTP
ncbi:xylulokinase [Rubritalea spongiae]|uniref:Xylulokinase n=1 Tax=Rubritalea spongiae TaxID=430797 RepID=A0ABW5E0F8_9BACT